MSWNLSDIQQQIASEIDQSATAPTTGGADWNIRSNAINRSQKDWAESYDWNVLLKVFNGVVSTATGNASYSMPDDFRKLDSYVRIAADGSTAFDFPANNASRFTRFTESDKFVNILGNPSGGYVMYIHSNALVSGASVQFTYFSTPTSLTTTTSMSPCPDPTFLVQRTLYYIYKSREDGRFPEAKVESDRILARLIENENAYGISHADRRVGTFTEGHSSFRIGRD